MTGKAAGSEGTRERTIVIDGDCKKVVVTIEIDGECGTTTTGGAGGGPRSGPTATPYLVIPSAPNDSGARPLPLEQALQNRSIQVSLANPQAPGAWSEFEVQLSCAVANLGAVPSSAALIEFYIGAEISVWAPGHTALTPSQVRAATKLVGRASFTAPPGITTTVACPVLWTPGSFEAAKQGVLVQVSDLFTDPLRTPFDAVGDRHVARADDVMDQLIPVSISTARQFEISQWVNDQFEIAEPEELAEKPRNIEEYPHWQSDPNSGVEGAVYLGGYVVYYYAPDPPKSGWWDMGWLPENLR
jgi:hypothetical protein